MKGHREGLSMLRDLRGLNRSAVRRVALRAVGAGLRLANRGSHLPRGVEASAGTVRSSTAGDRPAAPPKVDGGRRLRVLLIRPDHLGDVILTSPAVELLRRALPEAHLTMMAGPWSAGVARRDPMLDEVLTCPFPGFTRAPKGSALAPYHLLWRTASALRAGHYDAALVLRYDHWWGAWEAAQAGIPVRVGYGVPECAPFLTHALDPSKRGHWTEQALAVAGGFLAALGVSASAPSSLPNLRFGLDEQDEREAARLLSELRSSPGRLLVAFHPGSGSPLKLWPEDRWIELGWSLAARGAYVVVTGSPEELGTAGRIARALPDGASLAGRTTLGGLAALFRRCALVVGTDCGPLHLAVAAGAPTVHIFGPTDPAVYGPWGDPRRHRVVASPWTGAPCGRLDLQAPGGGPPACMGAITVEQVAEESREVLSAGS